MKRFIVMGAMLLMLLSCQGKKQQNEEVTPEQIEAGAKWIERLIVSEDGSLCISRINYEEVMTPRFKEFFDEAESAYASYKTEEESRVARQEYKKKWEGIYPLKEDDRKLFGEPWWFLEAPLYDLKISQTDGLTYEVSATYDGRSTTYNEVRLIPHEGTFRIDYAKVKEIKPINREQQIDLPPYYSSEERAVKRKAFEAFIQKKRYFDSAIEEELKDFQLFDEVVKNWGKPNFDCKITYSKDDYYYESCGITHRSFLTYDLFSASWVHYEDFGSEYNAPNLNQFSTGYKGFGFAGLYVGVPECNKETTIEYLSRWVDKDRLNMIKGHERDDEYLYVDFSGEANIEMVICFSEDGLIKHLGYSSGFCI